MLALFSGEPPHTVEPLHRSGSAHQPRSAAAPRGSAPSPACCLMVGCVVGLASRRRGRQRAELSLRRASADDADDGPPLLPEESWLNLEFLPTGSLEDGIIFESTASPVLAACALSSACLYCDFYFNEIPAVGLTILGTLLSLVTVFRTSQAYQRYWEARSHLGVLMSGLVDLAGSAGALLDTGSSEDSKRLEQKKAEVSRLLRLYMTEATAFLRSASIETKIRSLYWKDADEVRRIARSSLGEGGKLTSEEIANATEEEVKILSKAIPRVRTAIVLQRLRASLNEAAVSDKDGKALIVGSDENARLILLANQLGPALAILQREFNGCAKIATTPFPGAYVRIARMLRFALVYACPFFLAGKLGTTVVPVCMLVAFGYHGIDAIGNQLANPFVGKLGDSVLDGRFTKAVCNDVDALLHTDPHGKHNSSNVSSNHPIQNKVGLQVYKS